MPEPTPERASKIPPIVPPRPQTRCAPHRVGMVCFWALFLIFVATVAFLGDLAVTRNAGQSEPNPGNEGHTFFGILLAAAAIVVVIAVIARHHRIENSDDRYHR